MIRYGTVYLTAHYIKYTVSCRLNSRIFLAIYELWNSKNSSSFSRIIQSWISTKCTCRKFNKMIRSVIDVTYTAGGYKADVAPPRRTATVAV